MILLIVACLGTYSGVYTVDRSSNGTGLDKDTTEVFSGVSWSETDGAHSVRLRVLRTPR